MTPPATATCLLALVALVALALWPAHPPDGLRSRVAALEAALAEANAALAAARANEGTGQDECDRQTLECRLRLEELRSDASRELLADRVAALTARLAERDRSGAPDAAAAASGAADVSVAYTIPFVQRHLARVEDLVGEQWRRVPPCRQDGEAPPPWKAQSHLVFYPNRALTVDGVGGGGDGVADAAAAATGHAAAERRLRAALAASGADRCFATVTVLVANLTLREDPGTYSIKPVADQFFAALPALERRGHTHMAYMEPDTVPVRAGWLEALVRRVALGDPFWQLGSMYRGASPPHAFCYSLCGCAEHMNGNSVYNLRDPEWRRFLRAVHRSMDFASYNFDTFIVNQLRDAKHWAVWQRGAHLFTYTELIMHGPSDPVPVLLEKHPDVHLVHQAKWD